MITRFLDEPIHHRTTDDMLSRSMRQRGRVARYGIIGIIVLLGIVWMWGQWRALGCMLVASAGILATDRYVGRRLGRSPAMHMTRIAFAHACFATTATLCGGPAPMWLAMPYTAMAYDDPSVRRGWTVVLATCAAYLVPAAVGGIDLRLPTMFAAFALACRLLVDVRAHVVRSVVAALENQRDELASAHSELGQIHEQLAEQIEARERVEGELRQAQKLEAVGRLAAGVAHEINTPMQFINNNLEFIEESTGELLSLAKHVTHEDIDVEYIAANLPAAVAQALEGVQRVSTIVRSMQQVVHPGGADNAPIDINTTILNAITLSAHEYNLVAEIETELATLPFVRINGGELTQVLINIIVNAAHAITDTAKKTGKRGAIRLRSARADDRVAIFIADTGGGIPDSIRRKVFDPFFTTKPVGSGSGQGLAIARGIVERAGGELSFETAIGVGTTFCITLPVATAESRQVA